MTAMANDLIDRLIKEQEQVILGLDELNARIELVLKNLAPPPPVIEADEQSQSGTPPVESRPLRKAG